MEKVSFNRLPEDFEADIEVFEKEIAANKAGETSDLNFKVARVARGIYEHRQHGRFMMRVRIPGGGLTAVQTRKIAELGMRYGNRLHITDRQDVQIHDIDLDNCPRILRELYTVNLSSKGGGGNTVRNVTACSAAGVCAKEAFDVAPYAVALTDFMMTDPLSHTGKLPRKYKIAFSGCGDDCAFATVNDLGCIAKTKTVDGGEIQ
ncbi:MAG: sulfite reductase, beta subunit (hemoprotein), partial [bacterium]